MEPYKNSSDNMHRHSGALQRQRNHEFIHFDLQPKLGVFKVKLALMGVTGGGGPSPKEVRLSPSFLRKQESRSLAGVHQEPDWPPAFAGVTIGGIMLPKRQRRANIPAQPAGLGNEDQQKEKGLKA